MPTFRESDARDLVKFNAESLAKMCRIPRGGVCPTNMVCEKSCPLDGVLCDKVRAEDWVKFFVHNSISKGTQKIHALPEKILTDYGLDELSDICRDQNRECPLRSLNSFEECPFGPTHDCSATFAGEWNAMLYEFGDGA